MNLLQIHIACAQYVPLLDLHQGSVRKVYEISFPLMTQLPHHSDGIQVSPHSLMLWSVIHYREVFQKPLCCELQTLTNCLGRKIIECTNKFAVCAIKPNHGLATLPNTKREWMRGYIANTARMDCSIFHFEKCINASILFITFVNYSPTFIVKQEYY